MRVAEYFLKRCRKIVDSYTIRGLINFEGADIYMLYATALSLRLNITAKRK